uniref:Lipid phosphate phosphohydrolase 3-like n=2 Tax=Callorhinchus milii TaxID=7868 RepID=A0A4W3GR40_CALMI
MAKYKSDGDYTPTGAVVRIPESGGMSCEPEPGAEGHQEAMCSKMLLCLDLICIILASLPFFMVELNAVKPYERGFYCDDQDIQYPFKSAETVSDTVLCTTGILITVTAISLGECYRVRFLHKRSRSLHWNSYLSLIYKQVGCFLFGCATSQSLTDLAKVAVGRLRPNFLAVCKPDFTKFNCSRGYIQDPVCTGPSSAVTEARYERERERESVRERATPSAIAPHSLLCCLHCVASSPSPSPPRGCPHPLPPSSLTHCPSQPSLTAPQFFALCPLKPSTRGPSTLPQPQKAAYFLQPPPPPPTHSLAQGSLPLGWVQVGWWGGERSGTRDRLSALGCNRV